MLAGKYLVPVPDINVRKPITVHAPDITVLLLDINLIRIMVVNVRQMDSETVHIPGIKS